MSVPLAYTVERPRTHAHALARAGAVCLAAALALATVLVAFAQVTVHIDGRPVAIGAGWSVRRAGGLRELAARRGDLVSVSGMLLRLGLGGRARLLADGRELGPRERLYPGARLASARGRDVVEPVAARVVAVPAPEKVEGTGPIVSVVAEGRPGRSRVLAGALSGEVVRVLEVLREPEPRIVRYEGIPRGAKIAALTFDDGPWRGQTEPILRILAAANVKATFFMLGLRVAVNPDIARRVALEGHEVANHSMRHRYLRHAGAALARAELGQAQWLIRRVTGVTPRTYRPAGGLYNGAVVLEARRLGLRVIRWDVDPIDFRRPPPVVIVSRVVQQAANRPRLIILLHDGGGDRSRTIAALPRIITALRARGYYLVTVDQLLRAPR